MVLRLFESMDKSQPFLRQFLNDVESRWIFIIPSLLLIGLFFLPLVALIARSLDQDFFTNAFSEQALKALHLSLVTSTLTTLGTVIFGTPLAYILARW